MTLLIQAGLGVGLGIDVGIAQGSASVVLAFQVDNKTLPFAFKVILTGTASVEVLGGVASASITITAVLGIAVNPMPSPDDPDLLPEEIIVMGAVGIGIHISICWVIDVDFDGLWQFSKSFDVPEIPLIGG
jgi:hypothetical protein